MKLVPYSTRYAVSRDPFFKMQRDMMDAFFGSNSSSASFSPALDVSEVEDAYVVSAELAGMTADNIELTFEKNVLTLQGEKISEQRDSDEQRKLFRSERRYGTFSRTIGFPENTVDGDAIAADFEHGVLTITLPKLAKQVEPTKTIAINAG